MKGNQTLHDLMVEYLHDNPFILSQNIQGLGQNLMVQKDPETVFVNTFRRNKDENNRIYVQPDLIVEDLRNSQLYVFEVKSSNCESGANTGLEQLQKVLSWHKKQSLTPPQLYLITPKPDSELIFGNDEAYERFMSDYELAQREYEPYMDILMQNNLQFSQREF